MPHDVTSQPQPPARRILLRVWVVVAMACGCLACDEGPPPRPNILIAISDDQSWLHTGTAGDPVVQTPVFDRLARDGIRFENVFCASPSCSPSRAAILTGQDVWRLGSAANNLGNLDREFAVYPDLLERLGYYVGYTGKGWGPGDVAASGRTRNPAGKEYNRYGFESYVKNAAAFLNSVPPGTPFCLWFGSTDPHAPYTPADGARRTGIDERLIRVPPHLPDAPKVRQRLAQYLFEIQRFDRDLGAMLDLLEARGLRDNTLVIVTSDNGMDFPRGKVNLYDYGMRMPMAVSWPARIRGGRTVEDFVTLTDLAPTFVALAGGDIPADMTGSDLSDVLFAEASGHIDPARDHAIYGRERHSPYRVGMKSYPARAIRTKEFLYIRNFEPDRWPSGVPPHFGDSGARHIFAPLISAWPDEAERARFMTLCYGKRPTEELYHLATDPDQMDNVAQSPEFAGAKAQLWRRLERHLRDTGDPRVVGSDGGWDTMPWPAAVRPALMDVETLRQMREQGILIREPR